MSCDIFSFILSERLYLRVFSRNIFFLAKQPGYQWGGKSHLRKNLSLFTPGCNPRKSWCDNFAIEMSVILLCELGTQRSVGVLLVVGPVLLVGTKWSTDATNQIPFFPSSPRRLAFFKPKRRKSIPVQKHPECRLNPQPVIRNRNIQHIQQPTVRLHRAAAAAGGSGAAEYGVRVLGGGRLL